MFINPKIAIEKGWITHPDCSSIEDWEAKKFLSPNAIDFTLDELFIVQKGYTFVINEKGKQMRGVAKNLPITDRATEDEYWVINPNEISDGLSSMYVSVPEGAAAILVPRSTFVRNGLFLVSGLYDSGFKGHIGFTLHNRAGKAKVGVGTRVGQIIFVESENALRYAGGYNHEQGTNAPHQE